MAKEVSLKDIDFKVKQGDVLGIIEISSLCLMMTWKTSFKKHQRHYS